jgi:hypothetical protein
MLVLQPDIPAEFLLKFQLTIHLKTAQARRNRSHP